MKMLEVWTLLLACNLYPVYIPGCIIPFCNTMKKVLGTSVSVQFGLRTCSVCMVFPVMQDLFYIYKDIAEICQVNAVNKDWG